MGGGSPVATRSRWLVRSLLIGVVLLLLALTVTPPPEAQGQSGQGTPEAKVEKEKAEKQKVVSSGTVLGGGEEKKVLAYWTKERMKSAKPAKPPATGRPETAEPPGSARPEGPSGKIGPSVPIDDEAHGASRAQMQALAPTTGATPAAGYAYPFPYTRSAVPLSYYNSYPYKTFGKVFFVQNGRNYVCSGTVVNSENRSVIWTAGHCVHGGSGGRYHSNWIFVPAYRDGYTPFGKWAARSLSTTAGWASYGSFSYDLGAAVVGPAADGSRLANRVGALGLTWNQPYQQNWRAFGYPAASPFNGQRMYVCAAPTATLDYSNGSPATMGIGCDMTPGASGGGWTLGLSSSGGYVASVNSYKYLRDQPLAMYGPYQGTAAANLFGSVRTR